MAFKPIPGLPTSAAGTVKSRCGSSKTPCGLPISACLAALTSCGGGLSMGSYPPNGASEAQLSRAAFF